MPTPSSAENSRNVIPLFGSSQQDIADISRFVRSLDHSNHPSAPGDGDPLLLDDARSFNAAMQKLTLVLEQAPQDSRQRHESLPRVVEWLGLEGFDQQQAA